MCSEVVLQALSVIGVDYCLMAHTKQDLAALNRAIASGEKRVRFGDQEVEYRSTAELLAARNDVARALAASLANGLLSGRRFYIHQSGKGL